MKKMRSVPCFLRWVVLLAVSLLWASSASAATCTSLNSGNWSSSGTWSCGHVPTTADAVVITSPYTVALDINGVAGSLVINAGAAIDDQQNDLTVSGNITVNGAFGILNSGNQGTLTSTGNNAIISGTGVFYDTTLQIDANATIAAGSSLTFNGMGMIAVGVNNPSTLTINGTVLGANSAAGNGNGIASGTTIIQTQQNSTTTISSTGVVNAPGAMMYTYKTGITNNNGTVTLQAIEAQTTGAQWNQGVNSSLSISQTGNFNGKLSASATGNTVTYATGVTPIKPVSNTYYNLVGPTCAVAQKFIILGSSPCNPGTAVSSINLASTNPTSPATTVSWTVVFSTSVTGVTTSNFALVQAGGVTGATISSVTGSGTTWTVNANTGSGTGSLGLNMVNVAGITPAVTTAMPFVGQVYTVSPPFCSPPSNIPAGVTVSCVCDQFGRASLNPSTIFGGNWTISDGSTDTTGIYPYINTSTGHLRLTENTNNNAKAATVPSIFPAAGNYISVEFNHYAYQGGNTGADGVAVTLSDSSIPPVPGGFGGSLGYAQRNDGTIPPGFAGGWVGVALDEYGNYQNPTEGRILGPGFIPQSVGVRGPGSGTNGYRWMGGTASNSGGYSVSANSTSSTPAPGYMYQVIVDARNSGTGTINVSVNRDATNKDGSAYTSLFGPFNAYTEASYALSQGWITQVVPNYWKISFTGSTGGSTNIHEIGGLRICAQTVLPPTGGTASGFSAIDEAYPAAAGSTVPAYPNFQTGDIYMKLAGTPFKFWVAALTGSGISTGYSATSSKYVQVKIVDNTDNACGPDSARTCNSTCTNKSAVESGATQIATFPSGSSTGVASPSPSFTLNSSYQNLIAVMKECTTSACSAFTATAPACSADSFSVRPLSIASVTSSNATDTGTSGTPIFKAGRDNFSLTATTTGVPGYPSGYVGVMKINNAAVQAASPATVAGTVSGTTFPAATSATPSSTATGTTFIYSEAGGFTLPGYDPATDTTTVRGVYDDTWTGVDSINTKNDCVANGYSNTKDATGKYGCNFGLLPNTAVFGRFIPDHFVATGTLTNRSDLACAPASSFTYMGEPMLLTLTLNAQNAANAPTQNYIGVLAKLDGATASKWTTFGSNDSIGLGAVDVTSPATSLSARLGISGTPSASWTAGAGTLSAAVVLNRAASPDGAFDNLELGIAPQDADGVTLLPAALNLDADLNSSLEREQVAASKARYGRIRLNNAYGSELLALPIPFRMEYWQGVATGWQINPDDTCTPIAPANFAFAFPAGTALKPNNLAACETAVTVAGSAPNYTVSLSKPGTGNDGWTDLTLNLNTTAAGNQCTAVGGAGAAATTANAPWLMYNWTGAVGNPQARAVFGIYRPGPVIFRRERY